MNRSLIRLVVSVALVVGAAPVVGALSLTITPNQAGIGAMTDMCVIATGNDGTAVALQVDLSWDDRCVMPLLNDRGQPRCMVNPATGKSLLTRLQSASTRAILLSITSQSPIPDGQLFCCSFSVSEIPPSRHCMFNLAGASGSKADGSRLGGLTAQGAVLTITGMEQDQPTRGTGGIGPIVPMVPVVPQAIDAAPQAESPSATGPAAAAAGAGASPSDRKNAPTTQAGTFIAPGTPTTPEESSPNSASAPVAIVPDDVPPRGDPVETEDTPGVARQAGTPTVAVATPPTKAATATMRTPTPAANHTPTAATPALRTPQS